MDTDADGTLDCEDECPYDAATTDAGPAGCTPPACEGTAADLTPTFQCVLGKPDGSKAAVFSVKNASSCMVNVPSGSANAISPASAVGGPPTRFEPGFSRAFVTPIGTSSIVWTLGTRTATATPTGPACDNIQENGDSPVDLKATKDPFGTNHPAHASSATPLSFGIPKQILVTLGNAANGTATLTYRNGTGTLVTCTYRGGSSVAQPDHDLDRARGRYFTLESCSNGKTAGQTDIATQWDLQVNGGDPRLPTKVELPLGGGCSGRLESFISPEETVQLRMAFNWATTSELPANDSTGLPALHYALIYLESKAQFEALKRMKVFFRQRPLFASQLDRYRGRCGVFDNAGDMHGVFVHAFIPAALYNYLRANALQVLNAGQGEIPFRAIVLRAVPDAGLANPDGTLSWQALHDSGFRYFDDSTMQQPGLFDFLDDVIEVGAEFIVGGPAGPLLVQVGEEVIETDIRVAPKLDDIIEAGANIVETVVQTVADVLGEIQAFVYGSNRLKIQLTILNRDGGFDTNASMQRAWGPGFGGALVPEGAQAEFVAWGVSPPPVPILLPFSDSADIDANGRFTLDIANNLIPTAPGEGLCIHMENDSAMISDGITANEYCDFNSTIDNTGVINVGNRDIPRRDDPSDPEYYEVRLGDAEFNFLTQFTDSRAYIRSVIGRNPKQAEISVGLVANTIGVFQDISNEPRPFAGCFDFQEVGDSMSHLLELAESSQPIVSAAGTFGLVAYPFAAKDIFFPSDDDVEHSRGVATHEYGHFLMCDIFSSKPGKLLNLYLDRMGEGFNEGPEDVTAMSMESFADFFASQVVSGTNYFGTTSSADRAKVDYCVTSPCFEQNYRGIVSETPVPGTAMDPDEYRIGVRRLTTTFHDGFDNSSDTWRTVVSPTNGDAWVQPAGGTILVPRGVLDFGYMRSAEIHDAVELPGPSINTWMSRVANNDVDGLNMMRSLATTMYESGARWCQVCPLFAEHDPNFAAASAPLPDIWRACASGELVDILGSPPSGAPRLSNDTCVGCPLHQFSDHRGVCTPCPTVRDFVNDNVCETCPDGTVPSQAGERCDDCGADSISVGPDCVPCGLNRVRIPGTNTCADCTADAVIDAATFDANFCGQGFFDVANISPVGDNCPEELTIDVTNLDAMVTFNSTLDVKVRAFDDVPAASCGTSTVHVRKSETEFGTVPSGPTFYDYFINGSVCVNTLLCGGHTCVHNEPVSELLPGRVSSNGLTQLRLGFEVDSTAPPIDIFVGATHICPPPF